MASVIQDHKATLDLTTSKDGTTFHLYFPAITVPSLESQNAVNAQAITGNKTVQKLFQNSTVALIDDDRLLVEDYERILSELGLTVLTAHSGEEALHLLQMQQVDLIIIDFSMGEDQRLRDLLRRHSHSSRG